MRVRSPGCPGAGAAHGLLVATLLVATACSDAGPEIALVIEAPPSTEVTVGDLLVLGVTSSGEVGPVSWRSSATDLATVSGGVVEALRPGPVVITASASGAQSDDLALTVVPRPGGYTADEVDYFTEVAFGAEFGGATPLLRRWVGDAEPWIRVNGSPTADDVEVVDSVVAEIGRLTALDVAVVTDAPHVEVHFVPQAEFVDILPQAPPGNVGLVWLWWGQDQALYESVVLVATDIDPSLRAHIIREELTQMLGLLQDSYRYPESIFYQGYSTVTEYLPIDRTVIELLYRPELEVGLDQSTAARLARRLLRDGASPASRVAPGGSRSVPAPDSGGRAGSVLLGIRRPGSGGGGALSWSRSPLRPGSTGGYR